MVVAVDPEAMHADVGWAALIPQGDDLLNASRRYLVGCLDLNKAGLQLSEFLVLFLSPPGALLDFLGHAVLCRSLTSAEVMSCQWCPL